MQIYYAGTSLEADRVIYDQKTKRVHAEGNVRLTETNGRTTYGEIINLSDDFRDGFVDSLRLDMPEQTRLAARRADRSAGNITVFHSGVYTACEACAEDPLRPPKWQVKAARIIHDQGEQMLYFENSTLEFWGVPLAWMPYFSFPDPTAKRKTGFLPLTFSANSRFGVGITTPYYWALAPNYDATIDADVHDQTGAARAGRVAASAGERLLYDPGIRHLPTRQGRLCRHARRPVDSAATSTARVSSGSPTNGSSAGTERCSQTSPITRTMGSSKRRTSTIC